MTARIYMDSSALVKLARREPESTALRDELREQDGQLVTSIVGRIEFERAVRRDVGEAAEDLVEGVLAGVDCIPLNVALAGLAASLGPVELKSLDAIHFATLVAASNSISHVYCYDARLSGAVRDRGIEVRAPGAR